jgi:hypothetical protein
MAQSLPIPLLTTRARTATAVVVTAFILAQAIRGQLRPSRESAWLIPPDGTLPDWLTIILNVSFYAFLYWLGFCFIRGTQGRERLFMVAWFADLLLSPVRILGPPWSVMSRSIGILGLAIALFVAVSLLRRPSNIQSIRHPDIELEKIETKARNQRLLILGAVCAIALVLGALLYFIPLR